MCRRPSSISQALKPRSSASQRNPQRLMSEAPARAAALWVLQEWQRGKPQARRPETLIKRAFQKFNLDPRDKSLAMELAYGVIRHLLTLDHIISFYVRESGQGVTPAIRD